MVTLRVEDLPARYRLALAAACFLLAGIGLADAREKSTVKAGANACMDWCDKKNSTDAAKNKCYVKCGAYWFCNGSDASDPFYVAACKQYQQIQQQH